MTSSRRDFLRATSAATVLGLAGCTVSPAPTPAPVRGPVPAPPTNGANVTEAAGLRELAMRALDAAKGAGAQYADVRISHNRTQSIVTRELRVQDLSDDETFGFGLRALVDGAWGFAASSDLSPDEVVRVARQAVAQARANRSAMIRAVELVPTTPVPDGT